MKKTKEKEKSVELDDNAKIYQMIIEYEKNQKIDSNDFIDMFEKSLTRILGKEIDPEIEIKLELDKKLKVANIYNINGIVVEDKDMEETNAYFNISLSEARKILQDVQVDDQFKILIDLKNLKNVLSIKKNGDEKVKKIYSAIFNALKQNLSEYKKKQIYLKFIEKVGEKFWATVLDKNNDGSFNVSLELDNEIFSAFLPTSNISSKKTLQNGQKIEVILESVSEESKLSQLCVSVDSPKILLEKLKREIPEIANGLVEIIDLVRMPGERTKVAVRKTELAPESMDEIGSIIGVKGERINAISAELDGEKIDIIRYSDNLKQFLQSAMSPAKVIDVVPRKNEENCKSFYVIVEKKNLTNSIGKKGINVSLASNLTKTKIDVLSIEDAQKKNIAFQNNQTTEKPRTIKSGENNYKKNRSNHNEYFNNINIDLNEFDSDLESFREKEQEMIDSQNLLDINIEEIYSKHIEEELKTNTELSEEVEAKLEDKTNVKETSSQTKTNYKEVKEAIKNFKSDKDLANFGLDSDINLEDIEDGDWD